MVALLRSVSVNLADAGMQGLRGSGVREEGWKVQGGWRLLARYDTCHGWPHLDVVNGKGELVLKRWMEGMDTGEAFRSAVLDFEENHEKYN